jgi:hypothetical protein
MNAQAIVTESSLLGLVYVVLVVLGAILIVHLAYYIDDKKRYIARIIKHFRGGKQ